MRSSNGFLLINKPEGLTSFDVVRRMRRIFKCEKVGHAGTLDPLAEGLLIVAFGSATRLLSYLNIEPKVYRFELQFGAETDTFDRGGKIIRSDTIMPQEGMLRNTLPKFTGQQSQIPPAYSAIKIGGKRAYHLARNGLFPEMRPRAVTIDKLLLLNYNRKSGKALMEVTCSGGTYIRSLAHDIAHAMDMLGYAYSITRISCGKFSIDNALKPENIGSETELITINQALCAIPSVSVDDTVVTEIHFGRDIELAVDPASNTGHVILLSKGNFVALATRCNTTEKRYHPSIVVPLHERNEENAYSCGR